MASHLAKRNGSAAGGLLRRPARTKLAGAALPRDRGMRPALGSAAVSAPGAAGFGAQGAWQVGLLDELEQEAQKRRADADDAERRKAERDEVFRTKLDPGITALYDYLNKLIGNLKILQPKKSQRYAL